MNPLAKLILLVPALTTTLGHAAGKRVQDFVLDDHTAYAVPVSATRVTTISFPSPIAAIDGALTTLDGKTHGIFQIAHTKGTAYLSALALVKGGVTNLNMRWNNRTYAFELRESEEPCYSVVLQSPPERKTRLAHPLSPPRLFGMLDTARAFPLLKTFHPETVADVEHRDLHEQPLISDCGDSEVRLTDAFRFAKEDTLIFQLTVNVTVPPATVTRYLEASEEVEQTLGKSPGPAFLMSLAVEHKDPYQLVDLFCGKIIAAFRETPAPVH